MTLHKDQKMVQNSIIPSIMDRVLDEGNPVSERDCTVLSRMLRFGPDPLFLMEACPTEFADLCTALGLNVQEGRRSIEDAHEQGPGCLLDGKGLPDELPKEMIDFTSIPQAWRHETLWLVLASMSDCTEGGYPEDATFVTRVRRQARAIGALSRYAFGCSLAGLVWKAVGNLASMSTLEFDTDPLFGKPLSDQDHGFYIGFKRGYRCVAVQTGDLTFYGTIPETSLEEEGVSVDKPISPQFGIVFGKDD